MFISDSEASSRLSSESNLISRIKNESDSLAPASYPLPPDLPSFEDFSEASEEKGPILAEGSLPLTESEENSWTPEDLDKILNPRILNPRILKNGKVYSGRGPKGLHIDEQAAIGVSSGILGTTKGSRLGDVTYASGHSFKNGYTGNGNQYDPSKSPKEELRDRIIEGHGIIVDRCFNRLLTALDLLDDQKLGEVKRATELSIVAKNLSGIISSASAATQDKYVDNKEQSVHFHIMRPEPALHDDYPTVVINASESPDLPPQDPK